MQKTYIKYVYGAVLSHVISAVTLCPTLSEKKNRHVMFAFTKKEKGICLGLSGVKFLIL